MKKMRLQVAIAKSGIASRRKAAELIELGLVKVNKKKITEKGFRIDLEKDKIEFDGKIVSFESKKYYFLLNKPKGVLSTAKDERGRKKVVDYIKNIRVYPVGRLDKNSTGLIILTNDGDLTYRLTHPRYEIDRVYEIKVKGSLLEKDLERLRSGIDLDGKIAKATRTIVLKRTPHFTLLLLTLREGRKHEVRRMIKIGRAHV